MLGGTVREASLYRVSRRRSDGDGSPGFEEEDATRLCADLADLVDFTDLADLFEAVDFVRLW